MNYQLVFPFIHLANSSYTLPFRIRSSTSRTFHFPITTLIGQVLGLNLRYSISNWLVLALAFSNRYQTLLSFPWVSYFRHFYFEPQLSRDLASFGAPHCLYLILGCPFWSALGHFGPCQVLLKEPVLLLHRLLLWFRPLFMCCFSARCLVTWLFEYTSVVSHLVLL